MKVTIYTDGAARGNPEGPGGYGTVLQYIDSKGTLHEREYSAGYKKTTNNRMELMAAIVGLEALTKPCEVLLISDSKYVTDAFNQHWIEGWQKKGWKTAGNKPVKNIDLWERLLRAMEPHRVTFQWVRGTTGTRRTSGATSLPPRRRTVRNCLTIPSDWWYHNGKCNWRKWFQTGSLVGSEAIWKEKDVERWQT